MLPNLSKLAVSTGMSRLDPVYNEGSDYEKVSDREWMAKVLQENDHLVLPLFMNTVTCIVRYGEDEFGKLKELPIPLRYEGHWTGPSADVTFEGNGMIKTEVDFSFEMEEEGGLPLAGVIWEIYFPVLGLGPGWSRKKESFHEVQPADVYKYIEMPGEEGYEDVMQGAAWEAIKDNPHEQNIARGADSSYFKLDYRDLSRSSSAQSKNRAFQNMSSKPNTPPNGYNSDGFADSSVLYADYFSTLQASAQVVLDKKSLQKRYDMNNDPMNGDWGNDLSLNGRLKNIEMKLEFFHRPFPNVPLAMTGKRPRSEYEQK